MLSDYESELDPPTMTEFQLFLKLGNLVDAFDYPEQWPEEILAKEIVECTDLLEALSSKYDLLLGDYYKGQKESQ